MRGTTRIKRKREIDQTHRIKKKDRKMSRKGFDCADVYKLI